MHSYEEVYGVRLLDDIHNYFPDILYNYEIFRTVQDLLRYISNQTQERFNLYNRSLRIHQNHPVVFNSNSTSPLFSRPRTSIFTETIDISPIFTSPNLLSQVLNSLSQEPVRVAPSTEEINNSTTLIAASNESEICSICQEGYTDGQAIRKINHCGHFFHKACIDAWFERNVHCPVCRFDIRDTATQIDNNL